MNAMPLGEIFWNFLSASFSMKEGTNSKNLDSIMIPKAIGVCKSLFHVCTPKETKSMSIGLPCVEQADHHSFVLNFAWQRFVGGHGRQNLPSNGFTCSWRI